MRHVPTFLLALIVGALLGLPHVVAAQSAPRPMLIEGPTNTAVGQNALASNTTGTANTASGVDALFSNTAGSVNTANGYQALFSNTEGSANAGTGSSALYHNLTGGANSAYGDSAMYLNTEGSSNVAVGAAALYSNATSHSNTAVGAQALTAATGSESTALGASAGLNATTGSYNVFVGSQVWGDAADTNTIRIGLPYNTLGAGTGQNRTFIAGIYDTELTGNVRPVFIDENGLLGSARPPMLSPNGGGMAPASLEQQGAAQQERLRAQDAIIADLSARLARLEAMMRKGNGRK